MLVGELQPFVATFIFALKMRCTRCLQVVKKRCIAGACGPGKQLFAACEIPFGDFDHAAREFLAGASRTITACSLTQSTRCLHQPANQPDGNHQQHRDADENGHRHFDQVAAKADRHVTGIAEQEVCSNSTQDQCGDDDGAKFHCAGSEIALNCRSRRNELEMSGGVTANMPLRISSIVCKAPATCSLLVSKYSASQLAASPRLC